jgi:ribosomal protein L37E
MDGEREETMRGTYEIRMAAKDHRCSERSYHTIKAGDLYLCGSCQFEAKKVEYKS